MLKIKLFKSIKCRILNIVQIFVNDLNLQFLVYINKYYFQKNNKSRANSPYLNQFIIKF